MHWIAAFLLSASAAAAQLIAYESFSGMPTGGGISGAGSDATGWTQPSWQGSTAPYHSIGNQSPNMTYQITNGALLNGGDRCVILSTSPEPTSGTNAVARSFPPLNSTFFMSFVIRPLQVGTGTDAITLALRRGTNYVGGLRFKPNLTQTAFFGEAQWPSSGGGSFGSIPSMSANTNHLLVIRVVRPTPSRFEYAGWLNPSQSPLTAENISVRSDMPPNITDVDTLALEIFSSDNGGPSSTIAIDEIRIGYTWNDVVPQSTTQTVVPTLTIAPAVAVNWQSKTNKTYQPQRSYDLTNWVDFGATISGNGQQRSFLDLADQVPKSFYRVIER